MKVTIFIGGSSPERREVDCWPTPVPGLVLNKDPGLDGGNITHAPSGAALIVGIPDPELALDIVIRLGPLADWTVSGSALRKHKELGRAVQSIRDDKRIAARAFAVSLSRLAAVDGAS